MKPWAPLLATLLSFFASGETEAQPLFFARETATESHRISLTIEDGKVYGFQNWQPQEGHGSRGTLAGTISETGLIRVVHDFSIEGSEQSEEELLKLEGDRLLLGKGELVEGKGGRMKLKDPASVAFETVLKRITAGQPAPGSPERKAIMEAMRGPVSGHIGKAVTFTGDIRAASGWARFQGHVAPTDGKAPRDENAAAELELDFFALLKKDPLGKWQVMHWGFAGDISVREEAREKFPNAPWVLFE